MNKSTYRISDDGKKAIAKIKEDRNLNTDTAAIEYALASYISNQTISGELESIRKENQNLAKNVNELRRSEYVITAILNAMSLKMDIKSVLAHHEPLSRAPALISAQENLSDYLAGLQTQNEDRQVKSGASDAG